MDYADFLDSKRLTHTASGLPNVRDIALNTKLFDWQKDLVHWALRVGRANLWCDCGLGKSFMALEWSRVLLEQLNRDVIILTPLAVAKQFRKEGEKFGIEVNVCRSAKDVKRGINVTNYERLEKFDPDSFGAIVCDESSCLKALDGKMRKMITEFALKIPYRLGASATPAPNDYMEFGTQSEFAGSLSHTEMLATFFVHDGGDTSKWRLKRHAQSKFWEWLSEFAVYVRKPSDLGYQDGEFVLPPLNIEHHILESGIPEGYLFPVEAKTLRDRQQARRESLDRRVDALAEMVNAGDSPWVVWCDLNDESHALAKLIPTAIEVYGSMHVDEKEEALEAFTTGQVRDIISKCSIAGFGSNWQHAHNMAFCGLSDSWEQYYQGTRRCWRFGQKNPVDVHIFTSQAEGAVVANIQRKERDAEHMAARIAEHMHDLMQREVRGIRRGQTIVESRVETGKDWQMTLGDCVEGLKGEPSDSVDFVVYSPPFASLYVYSDALADMGNSRDHSEFYEHFRFCVRELFRTLKPGRLMSVHCMNLPTSKERDGYIGITDFRGDLIRLFQDEGFIYHSEVCIWKDPVTAMQRTKALGLLHKQIVKDSCMSRQGIPDYLVTMRKPGANPEPVSGEFDEYVGDEGSGPGPGLGSTRFSIEVWQRYASPVWMDINPSDTLQKESAREQEDERHIAPLQLQVIRRAMDLWSNPDDLVLSPFAGIGSEGYVAIQMGRRFKGFELKESYFQQACANLRTAHRKNMTLFDSIPESEQMTTADL